MVERSRLESQGAITFTFRPYRYLRRVIQVIVVVTNLILISKRIEFESTSSRRIRFAKREKELTDPFMRKVTGIMNSDRIGEN